MLRLPILTARSYRSIDHKKIIINESKTKSLFRNHNNSRQNLLVDILHCLVITKIKYLEPVFYL